jgi:exodeoxyribonuclease V beta subunit
MSHLADRIALRGRHLVEASAGTGKTWTIARLYERLVVEDRLEVSQILVVTFTRAATADLRARLRARLRGAYLDATDPEVRRHLREQVLGFDRAAIFTIHGFCQRALVDHAFESGVPFDLDFLENEKPLLHEIAADLFGTTYYEAPGWYLDECVDRVSASRLRKLAERAGRSEGLRLAPLGLDAQLERYGRARQAALELWERERAEIVASLTAPPLKKGDAGKLSARVDQIAASLADGPLQKRPAFVAFARARIANATAAKQSPPEHRFFDAVETLESRSKELWSACSPPDRKHTIRTVALQVEAFDAARRALVEQKLARGVLSFDDLLHRLAGALGSDADSLGAALRGRYRAALVDEFQDTDPVQWEIFRAAFDDREAPLLLVGDPKQSIYGFRGADVNAYLDARPAPDRLHTLGTNWRADPGLVRALDAMYERAPLAFGGADIRYHAVAHRDDARDLHEGDPAAPLQLAWVGLEAGAPVSSGRPERLHAAQEVSGPWIASSVAADLSRRLAGGSTLAGHALRPEDVAILCRTHRQAHWVQDALRALEIPSVLHGDASVLETDEAEELGRVLAALAEPTDRFAVRAALATRLLGRTASELAALRDDESAWDAQVQDFGAWHETWQELGFISAVHGLFAAREVHPCLLRLPDGERRLTNLMHLLDLLAEASSSARLGIHGLLRWFGDAREDRLDEDAVAADALQLRLESDASAVQILTIHKSKGIQWGVVYCPFLWNSGDQLRGLDSSVVPFRDDTGQRGLDFGSAEFEARKAASRRAAFQEAARVAYVAMTRAKHLCVVHTGPYQCLHSSPFAILLHGAGAADVDGARARLESEALTAAEIRADLDALIADAGGTIAVFDAPVGPGRLYAAPESHDGADLEARVMTRRVPFGYRRSSFTGLARRDGEQRSQTITHFEEELRQDEPDEPTPAEERREPATEDASPASAAVTSKAGVSGTPLLAELRGGTRTGTLIHRVLEHTDFQDPASLGQALREQWARDGRDTAPPASVERDLAAALSHELDPRQPGLRLAALPRHERLDELGFWLPVRGAWLTPKRLAAVFEKHGAPKVAPDYVSRLAALGFPRLRGFLAGEIDLVFRYAGADASEPRWYLVDYKTNRLGDALGHYAARPLVAAMDHGHYFLQYHLYTVALHRYLKRTLASYDYERCFGGVYYLFLRGMDPTAPPGHGVFMDRPSGALIEDLSRLLDGEVDA